jgi:predicted dehydrogenase
MQKTPTSRRSFVKGMAGFGAALALPNSKVLGANGDIRVGVVGVNGRGGTHLDAFSKMPGVRVAAICDIDANVLEGRVVKLSEQQGIKVKGFADMREMLDSGEIDVFSTATPNHWHSLAGIWALQAGKHAYVEKPISHNVWEGRQLVKVARKQGLLCQGGTQSRSMETIRNAVAYVHAGNLGKIQFVKGCCYKARPSIGKGGNGAIPKNVDYDKWCGPAAVETPLRRKKFHYDWHWFFEYGNGDMGNQGIHQMDVGRWFLGVNELSPLVMSIGARTGYDDDGETPNTQIVWHDYPGAPLIFETRGLPRDKAAQTSGWKPMDVPEEFAMRSSGIAVVVQCEGGRVFVDHGAAVMVTDNEGKEITKIEGKIDQKAHFENFVAAIHSGKVEDLNADCEVTHYSSALCHTGNVSHRLGQTLADGEIRERIQGTKLLSERYAAMAEHLAKNEVDVKGKVLTLGPSLKFNPKTEWFEGNGDLDAPANALATRVYRKGYEVPKEV